MWITIAKISVKSAGKITIERAIFVTDIKPMHKTIYSIE